MIGVRVSFLMLLPIDARRHVHGCSLARICLKVRPQNPNLAAFSTSVGADTDSNLHDNVNYSIRQVSNKARALDVKVFRGFSVSAREHIVDQQRKNGEEVSEAQAIDFLMKNYDNDGNYIMAGGMKSYEPETYFAAMYNGAERERMECFSRQNGIIGVVSAQLRRRTPLGDDPSELTATPPHIYIANMRVHDNMQRQGVGKALLSSVIAHAISLNERMDEAISLVLSVENDNLGAIHLYEQLGFEYVEKNKFFGLMLLLLPTKPKILQC